MASRLYTIPQVAERIGFSTKSVYRLIRGGRLRAVRLEEGGHWRVSDDALTEFIDALEAEVAS